jgi:hypothetical protein
MTCPAAYLVAAGCLPVLLLAFGAGYLAGLEAAPRIAPRTDAEELRND